MIDCRTDLISEKTSAQSLISGEIRQLGIPVSRELRAYSKANGALLGATKSDKSGRYKIYLPRDSMYTLVSIDPNKKFNAVIQDNVVPK